MIYTNVFQKGAGDITNSFTISLQTGETITSIVPNGVTPETANPPVITITSGLDPVVVFTATGGENNVTYGFPYTVTTNFQVFVVTIALIVTDGNANPYHNEDPDSYQDLVGDLEAGKSALATAVFQFDPTFDPSNGYVTWDLLDDQGTVYASGNAFSYTISATGIANVVQARCIINTPSDIPSSLDNPYQLRYTLKVQDKVAYSYEQLTIVGFAEMPVGCADSIEMWGDIATVGLVTEKLFQNYVLEIWADNVKLASMECGNAERVSSGYYVAGSLSTTDLAVTLRPYQIVWKFWNIPSQTFRETCALWVVNPSILQAADDVKSKVNKARHTLYGTPDSQFPVTEIMKWLRRAGDAFNGAYGVFTSFTFINAMAGVREYWLLYAEKFALESQYLLEGEKAFNFSGAAISLDVDRTGFLDSMASKIQSVLDSEFKPFKQNLVIKGNTGGDGSGDGTGNFNSSRRGAMGTVGVLLSPASLYGGGFLNGRFR